MHMHLKDNPSKLHPNPIYQVGFFEECHSSKHDKRNKTNKVSIDMESGPDPNTTLIQNLQTYKHNKTKPHWINKTNVHDPTFTAEISTDQYTNILIIFACWYHPLNSQQLAERSSPGFASFCQERPRFKLVWQ